MTPYQLFHLFVKNVTVVTCFVGQELWLIILYILLPKGIPLRFSYFKLVFHKKTVDLFLNVKYLEGSKVLTEMCTLVVGKLTTFDKLGTITTSLIIMYSTLAMEPTKCWKGCSFPKDKTTKAPLQCNLPKTDLLFFKYCT